MFFGKNVALLHEVWLEWVSKDRFRRWTVRCLGKDDTHKTIVLPTEMDKHLVVREETYNGTRYSILQFEFHVNPHNLAQTLYNFYYDDLNQQRQFVIVGINENITHPILEDIDGKLVHARIRLPEGKNKNSPTKVIEPYSLPRDNQGTIVTPGWYRRTYTRKTYKPGKLYHELFTPVEHHRFRSVKHARIFANLTEQNNNDEVVAKVLFDAQYA